MMSKAAQKISDTISALAATLGTTLNIELIEKFNIGVKVIFHQPQAWNEIKKEENSASASAMGVVLLVFIAIAGVASIAEQFKPKRFSQEKPPSFGKKQTAEALLVQEEARVRESTKPFTFKFKGLENGQTGNNARLDSFGNPVESNEEGDGQMENSIFNNKVSNESESGEQKEPIFYEIMSCFSIPRNLYALNKTKRLEDEHVELDAMEGIKVLTMCWALLTTTSLYVLTISCRNLYVMLDLFKQYLFACIASGNISPDLFIFMIYFIGFIKLSKFYDANDGI